MDSRNKFLIWGEILAIFVLGPLLIYSNILPFSLWPRIADVGFLIAIILSILYKTKLADLGLRKDNLSEGFKLYGIATGIMVAFVFLLYFVGFRSHHVSNPFLFYMIFINDPLQEFFYRGFLMERLEKVISKGSLVVLLNVVLFTFTHIIFKDLWFLLFVSISGFVWAVIYKKTKNVIPAAFSHSVVAGLAMYLGVI